MHILTLLLCLSTVSLYSAELIKVIITGHTLSGKTSTINELKARGYYVVDETATAVLAQEYQKLPENSPHHPLQIENLQHKIFAAQIDAYEKAVHECSEHPPRDNLIIFDRAIFDTYVYSSIFYPDGFFSTEEREFFKQIVCESLPNYSKKVIFCEIVPEAYYNGTLSNPVRHEEYEQSIAIGEQIRNTYQNLGFELHSIGFQETISNKADVIETILNDY